MYLQLKQKKVVLTGSLGVMTRAEAIDWIEEHGGIVQSMVTKDTDVLIVGFQQVNLFDPDKLSRKQQRAKELNKEGRNIHFLPGELFLDMIRENYSF